MGSRRTGWIPLLTLIAAAVAIASSWYDRSYNHDDFYVAYLGWLRSSPLEAGVDYDVPNFTPLADIASPLFQWFPESFVPLLIGKTVMLLVAAALLGTTIRVTQLLGGSTSVSLLSAALVIWQPSFIERISDIRADQIGALLIMLTIAAILQRRYPLAGFWFGGAVAISYKLVIAGPFFLSALLIGGGLRRWQRVFRFLLTAAVLPLVHLIWRLVVDGPALAFSVLEQVITGVGSGTTVRARTLMSVLLDTPLIFVGLLAGAIAMMFAARFSQPRVQAVYVLLVVAFLTTYVAVNPMIFPYNMVIFLPLVMPMVVGLEALATSARWRMAKPLLLITFSILAVAGGITTMANPSHSHRHSQERVIRWMWNALEQDEHAFDWQGMHLGRPGIYHWWIYSGTVRKYQTGEWYDLTEEWRKAQIKLILDNYRLNWVRPEDWKFLKSHFVWIDRCILVPGWTFSSEQALQGIEFDAFLDEGEYRWLPGPPQGVTVDGRKADTVETLRAGVHRLQAEKSAAVPQNFSLVHLSRSALQMPPPCPKEPLLGGF